MGTLSDENAKRIGIYGPPVAGTLANDQARRRGIYVENLSATVPGPGQGVLSDENAKRVGVDPTSLGSGGGGTAHLLTGLAAYWKLDETSGTRVNALGNSVWDMTQVNGEPGIRPGVIGNGYEVLQGNANVLRNIDHAGWAFPASVTFSGWLRMDVGAGAEVPTLISKWGAGTGDLGFILAITTAQGWLFSVTSDGTNGTQVTVAIPDTPTLGQYYFLCGWYDDAAHTINLQVNNGSISSIAFIGPTFHTTSPALIGGYWNGSAAALHDQTLVDEVGVWSRVLNPTERTALFNKTPFSSFTA